MPQHNSIYAKGMRVHYEIWRTKHPDAITYDRLVKYLKYGDEFGDTVSLSKLYRATKTSKTTFLKWLPIIKREEGLL